MILQMQELGLIAKWIEVYQPKPRRCLFDPIKNEKVQNELNHLQPNRITLKQFASGFVVLFIGCVASCHDILL